MFSVHTTPQKFENGTVTHHFEFVMIVFEVMGIT